MTEEESRKCYVCDPSHQAWDMCEKHEKELYDEVMNDDE